MKSVVFRGIQPYEISCRIATEIGLFMRSFFGGGAWQTRIQSWLNYQDKMTLDLKANYDEAKDHDNHSVNKRITPVLQLQFWYW